MPWLISGLVTIGLAVGRFLWKNRVLAGTAAAAGTLGYDIGSAGKKEGEGDSKPKGGFPFWIMALLAPLVGLIAIIFLRPKKGNQTGDTDFYAGALGLDPEQAKKCSPAFLKGKLSAMRREAKWGNPGEILGLQPTGVTAHYGKESFKWQ